MFLSAEVCSNPSGSESGPTVPEDLGRLGAKMLLEEVYRGGCADSCAQSLVTLFMAMGPTDVSKFVVGPLSPYTVQFLRHTRDFLDVMFKLETRKVMLLIVSLIDYNAFDYLLFVFAKGIKINKYITFTFNMSVNNLVSKVVKGMILF